MNRTTTLLVSIAAILVSVSAILDIYRFFYVESTWPSNDVPLLSGTPSAHSSYGETASHSHTTQFAFDPYGVKSYEVYNYCTTYISSFHDVACHLNSIENDVVDVSNNMSDLYSDVRENRDYIITLQRNLRNVSNNVYSLDSSISSLRTAVNNLISQLRWR